MVFSRASLTSWGEGASLALVGHPSSDVVTIKMPYGVDVLLPRTTWFPIGLVKTESDFIVRSVETGLVRWTLLVVVISVDAYPFSAFSDVTCHLEQGLTVITKSPYMITYMCQNFGVCDVCVKIPKNICKVPFLLPCDFSNNFS